MSDEKKTGHGITGKLLQQWCADGTFKVYGDRVLCEALLEQEATGSDLMTGVKVDPRTAVAFRVAAVGPSTVGISVGDIVLSVSISGESIDHGDNACRWWVFRSDHLLGGRAS